MEDSSFKVQEFVAHSTAVNCLAFGPKSNQVLATGGEDQKVNIWRVGNLSNIWSLGKNKSPIESLCFDSEEQCVVSGALNGSLKVFDLNEGRLARNLGGHQVNVSTIQYHPFGEFIVSGTKDCTMKVWDVRNKVCIQTYTGHMKELTCVRFSPDGKWVASASRDGQLLLWDLVAGKLINWLKLHPVYLNSFEFNPAEFSLAGVTSQRTVKLWDLDNMAPLYNTPPESGPVRSIAFNNLGSLMCSATKDNLKLWEVSPTYRSRGVVNMGWDKIVDMKIVNNSQLIAGSFVSNFVSVWAIDLEEYLSNTASNEDDMDTSEAVSNKKLDEKITNDDMITALEKPIRSSNGSQKHDTNNPTTSGGNGNSNIVSPPSSRALQQQQQLNQVKQKLSQLSSDLGLDTDQKESLGLGVVRNATSTSSSAKHSIIPMTAEAKVHAAVDRIASKAAQLGLEPPAATAANATNAVSGAGARNRYQAHDAKGSRSMDNDDYSDDDFKQADATDDNSSSNVNADPNVVWDSAHAPQDMAMSMGESFWNRFKHVDNANNSNSKTHEQRQQQEEEQGGVAKTKLTRGRSERASTDCYDDDDAEPDHTNDDEEASDDDFEAQIERKLMQQQQKEVKSKRKAEELIPNDELDDMLPYIATNNNNHNHINNNHSSVSRSKHRYQNSDDEKSVVKEVGDALGVVSKPKVPIVVRQPPIITNSNASASASDVQQEDGSNKHRPTTIESARNRAGSNANAVANNNTNNNQIGYSPRALAKRAESKLISNSNDHQSANDEPLSIVGRQRPPVSSQFLKNNNNYSNYNNNNNGGIVVVETPTVSNTHARVNSDNTVGNAVTDRHKCDDLIEQLLLNNKPTTSTLSQRLVSLRALRKMWSKGEVSDAIEQLAILTETMEVNRYNLGILADFFMAIELKSSGLSLDACVKLLPVLEDMLGLTGAWTSEHVVFSVYKSLINLGEAFGELIRGTRSIMVAGGVDLNREARLSKCNICHGIFIQARNRVDPLKQHFKRNNRVADVLDDYNQICNTYFN